MDRGVSIIVPVYNAASSLRRCVESLVYGNYEDIEVILVEDCSKDSSWDECKRLASEYTCVKCFQNSKNSGVSYTRNHGVKKATGKYLCFVDSDDWVSGDYINRLVACIQNNEHCFPICGFHFIDEMNGYETDYLWNEKGQEHVVLQKQLFDVLDKILLQEVWNKLFITRIVQENGLHFDETQSMGEDFQFVLDYIAASKIQKFLMISDPLYYYVRANSNSLMSNFGKTSIQQEISRYHRLLELSGNTDELRIVHEEKIRFLQDNFIYHLMHDKRSSKQEKLEQIKKIKNDEQEMLYYNQFKKVVVKEHIVSILRITKSFIKRVVNKIQRIQREIIIKKVKKRLHNSDFTVISQNCIGGVFYHDMGMRFLSPTINLYFEAMDFVKFARNLKTYIGMDLQMKWSEKYPIGQLGDINIHFMHYSTCSEAKATWERRKERINYEKLLVLSTDMEGFEEETYELWKEIKFPKILFSAKLFDKNDNSVVVFSKYETQGCVADLIPKREFYKGEKLMEAINRL